MTISGFVAYVKQVWKNKPDTSSPLSAERLNTIEGGIKGNSDAIAAIAAAVVNQIVNDPNKIASMAALYSVNSQVTQLNSDLGKFVLENVSKVRFSRGSTGMNIDIYFSDVPADFVRLNIGYTTANRAISVQTYTAGVLAVVYSISPST